MALQTKTTGFTLVEVVVAIAVFMVIIVGSLSANNLTTTAVSINKKRSQANILAKEAMEALMSIRSGSFTSLVVGDFHPVYDLNGWRLVGGAETLGEFSRKITLSSVMRTLVCSTPVCPIVSEGGFSDPNSFMANIKVTWREYNQDKEYNQNN